MKLTATADFYIEKYGLEAGVTFLKNLGYQNMIYTLTAQRLEPFLGLNQDCEMKETFGAIGKAFKNAGVNLLFTTMKEEVYHDLRSCRSCSVDSKKELVIQAVKATAYMGGKVLVVRPICFRHSTADAWDKTKQLTYEIYLAAKKEADRLGVKIAFFNNTKQLCFSSGSYSYGCRSAELAELADTFESGIVINPVYALYAGERVEELLAELGDKVIGFMVEDKAQRATSKEMPFFGSVDYYGLIEYFKNNPSDMAIVMAYTQIMNRYVEFADDMELVTAITKAFMKMACLIANCDAEKLGMEAEE